MLCNRATSRGHPVAEMMPSVPAVPCTVTFCPTLRSFNAADCCTATAVEPEVFTVAMTPLASVRYTVVPSTNLIVPVVALVDWLPRPWPAWPWKAPPAGDSRSCWAAAAVAGWPYSS